MFFYLHAWPRSFILLIGQLIHIQTYKAVLYAKYTQAQSNNFTVLKKGIAHANLKSFCTSIFRIKVCKFCVFTFALIRYITCMITCVRACRLEDLSIGWSLGAHYRGPGGGAPGSLKAVIF